MQFKLIRPSNHLNKTSLVILCSSVFHIQSVFGGEHRGYEGTNYKNCSGQAFL